ncbi:hypothetical protein BURMUCF1_A1841 [Burkholderia multivorans ATCC BAA-247]|nr:hypothetical protein BURMUCF1_A1841 [Burkholderia multivorans ATCC BAA-247]
MAGGAAIFPRIGAGACAAARIACRRLPTLPHASVERPPVSDGPGITTSIARPHA